MKKYFIAQINEDGGLLTYPMKEWLRQNKDQVPEGLDATLSTSHELRNGLRKKGWTVQESESDVKLIRPGEVVPQQYQISDSEAGEEDEVIGDISPAFELEYQLRDFISQNLQKIPVAGKKLRLYVDNSGRDGVEYPTQVGPIDILAVDSEGNFYIFELKRSRSPDHAIGQLSRYMGWVSQTVGKNKKVFGVIVAKTISENLKYSILIIPNVKLFEYSVEFSLQAIENINK